MHCKRRIFLERILAIGKSPRGLWRGGDRPSTPFLYHSSIIRTVSEASNPTTLPSRNLIYTTPSHKTNTSNPVLAFGAKLVEKGGHYLAWRVATGNPCTGRPSKGFRRGVLRALGIVLAARRPRRRRSSRLNPERCVVKENPPAAAPVSSQRRSSVRGRARLGPSQVIQHECQRERVWTINEPCAA